MSEELTTDARNLACILRLIELVRDGNQKENTAGDIAIQLAEAVRSNIIDSKKLSNVVGSLWALRVRFFDVAGGVEQVTFKSPSLKPGNLLLENAKDSRGTRLSIMHDRGVSSVFDPRLRPPETHSPKPKTQIKNLMIIMGAPTYQDPNETEPPPSADFMTMQVPADVVKSDGSSSWPQASWNKYLHEGLHLSSDYREDDARMKLRWADAIAAFKERLSSEAAPVIEYDYLMPITIGDELVCVVSAISSKPFTKSDWRHIQRAIITIGGVSSVLSSRILSAEALSRRPGLTTSYFETQSPTIWEQPCDGMVDHMHLVNIVPDRCLAKHLKKAQCRLMLDIPSPLGERAISETILSEFAGPCLREYVRLKDPNLLRVLGLAAQGEERLREIPRYRQHFIHSFHVCLTGIRLLFEAPTPQAEKLIDVLCTAMNVKQKELVQAWILTSLYHDVAYVATNVEEWVGGYLTKIMIGEAAEKDMARLVLNDMSRFIGHSKYPYALDVLASCLQRYSPDARALKGDCLNLLLSGIIPGTLGAGSTMDHGIVSALMLIEGAYRLFAKNSGASNIPVSILLAADAIACHDKLWQSDLPARCQVIPTRDDLPCISRRRRNYLRDLLVVCDNIQQWGRTESDEAQRLFTIGLDTWSSSGNRMWDIGLKYKFSRGKEGDAAAINSIIRFGQNWPKVLTGMSDSQRHFYLPGTKINVHYRFDLSLIPQTLRGSGGKWDSVDFAEHTWPFDGLGCRQ